MINTIVNDIYGRYIRILITSSTDTVKEQYFIATRVYHALHRATTTVVVEPKYVEFDLSKLYPCACGGG